MGTFDRGWSKYFSICWRLGQENITGHDGLDNKGGKLLPLYFSIGVGMPWTLGPMLCLHRKRGAPVMRSKAMSSTLFLEVQGSRVTLFGRPGIQQCLCLPSLPLSLLCRLNSSRRNKISGYYFNIHFIIYKNGKVEWDISHNQSFYNTFWIYCLILLSLKYTM